MTPSREGRWRRLLHVRLRSHDRRARRSQRSRLTQEESMECEGRVAFVTGASRGIGAAIAERLAAAGARGRSRRAHAGRGAPEVPGHAARDGGAHRVARRARRRDPGRRARRGRARRGGRALSRAARSDRHPGEQRRARSVSRVREAQRARLPAHVRRQRARAARADPARGARHAPARARLDRQHLLGHGGAAARSAVRRLGAAGRTPALREQQGGAEPPERRARRRARGRPDRGQHARAGRGGDHRDRRGAGHRRAGSSRR